MGGICEQLNPGPPIQFSIYPKALPSPAGPLWLIITSRIWLELQVPWMWRASIKHLWVPSASSCSREETARLTLGVTSRTVLTSGLAFELGPDCDVNLEDRLHLEHKFQPEGGSHLEVGGCLPEDGDVVCKISGLRRLSLLPCPKDMPTQSSQCWLQKDLRVLYGSTLVSPLLVTTSSSEMTILSWRDRVAIGREAGARCWPVGSGT